jgi:hypothetical protein
VWGSGIGISVCFTCIYIVYGRGELGIGSIRDGFADILFPGTSTIQTRVRYFLFIPWMYDALEKNRISSEEAAPWSRQREIALVMVSIQRGEGSMRRTLFLRLAGMTPTFSDLA